MGPGSSIILKDALKGTQLDLINNTLDSISDSRKDEDFWVSSTKPIGGNVESDGRPFIITHDKITLDNSVYDKGELRQIYKSIGYKPKYSVSLGAMCNDDVDHKVLGEITLYLARKFGGHINFEGAIFSFKYLPKYRSSDWYFFKANWSSIEPYFKKFIKDMPGNIYTIKYKTASEKKWAYHICDVEFLEFWLNCPEFHMIK